MTQVITMQDKCNTFNLKKHFLFCETDLLPQTDRNFQCGDVNST